MSAVLSSIWQLLKSRKLAILLLILLPVLFGLGVYGFLRTGSFLTVFVLYSWMWGWLHEHLGLHVQLARAVAALCALPLLLVLGMMFASDPQVRRKGIALFFAISACVFVGMYFMTRDWNFDRASGEPARWYVMTLQGCRFFDAPGYDPELGIALKPVTTQALKECEALERGFASASVDQTQDNVYFDRITGEPVVWYFKHADGSVELFSMPGFHPRYQSALKPITVDVVREMAKQEQDRQAKLNQERQVKQEQDRQANLERQINLEQQAKLEKEREAKLEQDRQATITEVQTSSVKSQLGDCHAPITSRSQQIVDAQEYKAWAQACGFKKVPYLIYFNGSSIGSLTDGLVDWDFAPKGCFTNSSISSVNIIIDGDEGLVLEEVLMYIYSRPEQGSTIGMSFEGSMNNGGPFMNMVHNLFESDNRHTDRSIVRLKFHHQPDSPHEGYKTKYLRGGFAIRPYDQLCLTELELYATR